MSEQAMNAPLPSRREAGLTEALDRRHLMHPFSDLHHMAQSERTVIARAKGNYVWDESGRRFLDGLGGMWCSKLPESEFRDVEKSRC